MKNTILQKPTLMKMVKNVDQQVDHLGKGQTGSKSTELCMVYHLILVKRQSYKYPVLLSIPADIFLVAVFPIAYFRIFESLKQFSTKQIAWKKVSQLWAITIV